MRLVHHGRCGLLAWLVSEDSGISVPGSLQGRREWLALRLLIDGVKELGRPQTLIKTCLQFCGGLRGLASFAKLLLAWFALLPAVVVRVLRDPGVAWWGPYRAGASAALAAAAAAPGGAGRCCRGARSILRSTVERSSGAYYHRFFRVDESFRANTRAGLTRARSLSTCV